MRVQHLAAFAAGDFGGNPAGVVLCDALPPAAEMQALAAQVGHSETAFAAPAGDEWRVRYFAPAMEIPFCGHATIALGAALALARGDGVFGLQLNDASISVEGCANESGLAAAFISPPTRSAPAPNELLAAALHLFSLSDEQLDARLAPAIIEAGARHLLLPLASRGRLRRMDYDMAAGAALMGKWTLATICLIHAETPSRFHARNAFAVGGVFEDPATGAAAAALAGYLRDTGWPHAGALTIRQGEDMGVPCRLETEVSGARGAPVRVSGAVRFL